MKKRITPFTTGFLTAALLLALGTSALAASGKVSYNFANVALNGETKIRAGADITAANGQKIPGTILFTDDAGGRTNYLPIRAVSELLGVEIGYDSATRTVLLGSQPAAPASSASGYTAAEMAGALRGDAALIQSRGGTLLPDGDSDSYIGINDKVYKLFRDRNGDRRVEYFVGNRDTLRAGDVKLLGQLTEDGDYQKNSQGERYGSVSLADYVGYAPDLQHMAAYPHEGRPEGYIRDSELQAGGDALEGLSEEACPHEYEIPLYDQEGNVIGVYRGGCQGHLDTTGMTVEEAKAALEKAQG